MHNGEQFMDISLGFGWAKRRGHAHLSRVKRRKNRLPGNYIDSHSGKI
jgi:hypothetical protein